MSKKFKLLQPKHIDPITGVKTFKVSKKQLGIGGYSLVAAKTAKRANKLSKKWNSWMSYEQEDDSYLVEQDTKVTIIQDFGPEDVLDLPKNSKKALKGKSFGFDLYPGIAFTLFNKPDQTDLGIVIVGEGGDFTAGINII